MEVCERLIGPPEVIGPICGLSTKRPYGFRHAAGDRDAGDFPSVRHIRNLKRYSDEKSLGLELRHLIYGATAEEIDAILAARDTELAEPQKVPA